MAYFKKIEGERVYLSPYSASEAEVATLTEWMNDFGITDYIYTSGMVASLAKEKAWLESAALEENKRNFAIVEAANDEVIGSISLDKIDSISRSAELGIFIGKAARHGRGYGTEAVNLILEYGFRYLNLHSVQLKVIANNERAHKCYIKCGFRDAGRLRESIFVGGEYRDELWMDILASEFKGGFIKNKNL